MWVMRSRNVSQILLDWREGNENKEEEGGRTLYKWYGQVDLFVVLFTMKSCMGTSVVYSWLSINYFCLFFGLK